MKRVYLALLCVLALLLAGCTDINQNNSFVGQPTAKPAAQTEIPVTPAATQPPVITPDAQPLVIPEMTLAPGGENPISIDMPDVTEPLPTDTPAPNSGFNG